MDDRSYSTYDGEQLKKIEIAFCSLCREIEARGLTDLLDKDPNVKGWWEHHKAIDAARIAREEAERRRRILRRVALDKLSDEEKAALGLER